MAVEIAVDGARIRAVSMQDVRLEYVTRTMRALGLTAAGSSVLVWSGQGLLSRGLAGLGFDVADQEGPFDVVYCSDTFEVATDLAGVVERVSAALKPGGVLIYDTVNDNPLSRLVYLGLFQGLKSTRIMPAGRYAAERLRKPAALAEVLGRHGLRNEDVCAFKPKNPLTLLKATRAARRGDLSDADMARLVAMVLDPKGPPLVTYFGHARKV